MVVQNLRCVYNSNVNLYGNCDGHATAISGNMYVLEWPTAEDGGRTIGYACTVEMESLGPVEHRGSGK